MTSCIPQQNEFYKRPMLKYKVSIVKWCLAHKWPWEDRFTPNVFWGFACTEKKWGVLGALGKHTAWNTVKTKFYSSNGGKNLENIPGWNSESPLIHSLKKTTICLYGYDERWMFCVRGIHDTPESNLIVLLG